MAVFFLQVGRPHSYVGLQYAKRFGDYDDSAQTSLDAVRAASQVARAFE